LQVRDDLNPKMRDRLNNLAYEFATQVNGVHERAFNLNGESGVALFSPLASRDAAANSIRISDALEKDLGSISAAFKMGAVGDNRALLDIADLQDRKLFDGGTSSFSDQTSTLVGTLGVDVKSTNERMETQNNLVAQLNAAREQISGVSLDEETITLIQFQKAFDASAKMIQVADNLMDTVLNLKKF
jgi:flagellar hook-associated protein 1 FlgK